MKQQKQKQNSNHSQSLMDKDSSLVHILPEHQWQTQKEKNQPKTTPPPPKRENLTIIWSLPFCRIVPRLPCKSFCRSTGLRRTARERWKPGATNCGEDSQNTCRKFWPPCSTPSKWLVALHENLMLYILRGFCVDSFILLEWMVRANEREKTCGTSLPKGLDFGQ